MKPYRLSILTGINWGIIKKYVRGDLYRVDLDLLAHKSRHNKMKMVEI